MLSGIHRRLRRRRAKQAVSLIHWLPLGYGLGSARRGAATFLPGCTYGIIGDGKANCATKETRASADRQGHPEPGSPEAIPTLPPLTGG